MDQSTLSGVIAFPDEARGKELVEAFHKKFVELDQMQINGKLQDLTEFLAPQDIPVISYGIISEISSAVATWPKKKEVMFNDKLYKTYSTTLVDLEGESKLLFTEVQLMYNNPGDALPCTASVTETKPDENGTLHERHFSVKFYSEQGAELQYVEYPYRQKENGKPTINTKALVIVARRMIQQLPRSG